MKMPMVYHVQNLGKNMAVNPSKLLFVSLSYSYDRWKGAQHKNIAMAEFIFLKTVIVFIIEAYHI